MGGAQVKGFDKYFGSRKRIKQSVMFKQKRLGIYDIGCYEHEKMMVRGGPVADTWK